MPNQGSPARPDPGSASRLNRVILLLNVIVLVVTFVLAFQTMDSQIGLVRSSVEAGNLSLRRYGDRPTGAALPYARVVQSLDGIAGGKDEFARGKLRAVYDAVRIYQRTMAEGVTRLLFPGEGPEDLRQSYAELGKAARAEVEITLAKEFSDPLLLRRLTTEVIRACQ